MRRLLPLLLACGLTAADEPAAPPRIPDPPRLVGPRRPPERDAALKANGGTAETERAVVAGLDWLARHAGEDGGWDADGFPERCAVGGKACEGVGKGQHGEEIPCPFDDALTALAALAFLGHGEVPEKALSRLGSVGDPWALALATEALAEAEVLERKGRWGPGAKAGAARILAARGEDGGWGYAAGFRSGSDVPYTALVVPALLAARDAGVELPTDLAAGVDRFLGSLEAKEGRLAYLLDGRAYGYTPTSYNAHAAAAVRELLQTGRDGARHRAHLALVRGDRPRWEISWRELDVPGRGRTRVQIGSLSMMAWWHGTVATFQRGGGDWSAWFASAAKALVPHQRRDGCARGSWDPEGQYERMVGGRVMSTALGVLILEAPYRSRRL